MSKFCLITGGTGFVGQRLVSIIHDKIKILSRTKQPDYNTVVCNLGRDVIPSNALIDVESVFHLAGFTHDSRDTNKVLNLYRRVNVDATVELANLAAKSGVKKFIFVSSIKAGGRPDFGQCANEENQVNPEGVYGETKREAELKLLAIGKESGMHVSIIRSSLVYGPNVKGNLKLMLAGIKKGWFPPLPETGNRRSMIHVDDLVRAILLVADDDHANGEIFIATDGKPYSSREIYSTMCNIAGKSIPKWGVPKFLFNLVATISPKIRYKVDKLLGDECYSSEKLEMLGFEPKRTLKEMNETDF